MTAAFLVPFLGHFALVVFLYALLTWRRLDAVKRGAAKMGDYVRAGGDTPEAARVRRNLSNQFEAPLFAYFAALFLLWSQSLTWFDVIAAWVFLIGRLAHTAVQVLTDNVRLRGRIFTINFLAICALMAHVAWIVLAGKLL
jgi:hypothetical protein